MMECANMVSEIILECIYILGVMVRKIHGLVRYNTVGAWFGTFSIQQKERNARYIFLIVTIFFIKIHFLLWLMIELFWDVFLAAYKTNAAPVWSIPADVYI